MAYDPIQKILAVGAKDGSIKMYDNFNSNVINLMLHLSLINSFGKPGLEVLLESQFRCPIRDMCFLPNKVAFMEVLLKKALKGFLSTRVD